MADSGTGGVEASSVFVTAPDGLKLHVRCYGPRLAPGLPVVCLPGLTRTTADFDDLAVALAVQRRDAAPRACDRLPRPRPVGLRPRSPQLQPRHRACRPRAVLTALDVAPAVFVGTSRGGILTMLLASARPTAIAGAVLNDIGPVIEPTGLVRIKSYVGKLPQPKSFEEGAEIFRRLFGQQFTRLTDEEWLGYSRRSFKVEQHRLVPTYDVQLARTMDGIDFDQPLPPLWPQFDGLGRVPLMVIRGAEFRPAVGGDGRGHADAADRRWRRSRCRTRATRRSSAERT